MRTRMGLTQIAESDNISHSQLQDLLFANRSLTAELFKAQLVSLCGSNPLVPNSQDVEIDISSACDILAAWDGRYNIDSVGAVVFRQTLSGLVDNQGLLDDSWYETPFDPANPVTTPNGLSLAGKEGLLIGMADAVSFINATSILDDNGEDLFTLDAPLGDVQFTIKGDIKIPLHGGLPDTDGIFNKVESKRYGTGTLNTSLLPGSNVDLALDSATDLSSNGYHINYGASYILSVALTEDGPQAQAMLSYSQTEDPNSSHFSDQTLLYSNKLWRQVLFNRSDILADESYQVQMISK
jgi:acyl-homoserine-lactone acylase